MTAKVSTPYVERTGTCSDCGAEFAAPGRGFVGKRCAVHKREWERNHWRRVDPKKRADAMRRSNLKMRFNISLEDWTALLKEQGGRCAICRSPDPRAANWSTDHDHATGRIRGILCSQCNRGLGFLGDTEEALAAALAYLRGA